MKFNIVKQPFGIAIITLIAILVLSLNYAAEPIGVSSLGKSFAEGELVIRPLGELIGAYEAAHPTSSAWIAGLLLFVTATILTRTNYRYSLYGTNTCIAFPIFAMVMTGCLYAGCYLTASLVAMFTALMFHHIFGGFRNGFGFDHLFRGSVCLGMLLLIDPATIPFVLLIPMTSVTLRRTAREMTVMLGGLLLPVATLSYLNWALGGDLHTPIEALYREATTGEWLGLITHSSVADRIFFVVVMVATAIGSLLFLANSYALSNKARHLMIFTSRAWLLALLITVMPSASISLLGALAIPCSLLLPVLFIRTHRTIAQLLYLLFLVATVATIMVR